VSQLPEEASPMFKAPEKRLMGKFSSGERAKQSESHKFVKIICLNLELITKTLLKVPSLPLRDDCRFCLHLNFVVPHNMMLGT